VSPTELIRIPEGIQNSEVYGLMKLVHQKSKITPMKKLYLLISTLAIFGATSALRAGPGAEYFTRVDSVSKSSSTARNNAVQAPTSKCKVTEVVQVTTGPHGAPVRQVISTNMDCSQCKDSSMSCCAGKAKS
jgi:hypothetical protein